MINHSIKTLALISLATSVLSAADSEAFYGNYINNTYNSGKNTIMGGATTATAKGYSAMQSNPAGLSTNHNMTVYLRSIVGDKTDSDGTALPEINGGDHTTIGALYNSFGVEVKDSDYILGAGAYGFETKYGLFSAGLSYLMDDTDLTLKGDSTVQDEEFATGDYLSYGLMWQKTFLDEEDFYALYFGLSHKNSGVYSGEGTPLVIASPSRTSYGIGLETNMFDTSVLFTFDISEEKWQTINEKLSGVGTGIKWMINHKFAIGGGVSTQTFSGSLLKDIQTSSVGIEFGFLGLHTNTAFTNRKVNDSNGVYLEENALHIDIALTF